ncbi:carboxymuconolactone decarboxylase family protein [Pseudothauera rhizosphaerae]|uniref:Carboxymuconolactone decarboxylase family protein n=1 Tax=Pseudothauera rhizosphaerae TaxID=2565932 RepID=A0A4S4AYH9_9RHOO|nr:carboxymuconolactone decarboxylase family protein [Pseudothauera rhizosphaerae]THF65185.1 carboxymuconolactone decarboxylase family protein [Pseudothauera rhizosphaerae]
MSRLPLQTAASAPEASRALVERVIANNGFLPNLVAALANAPVALETYLTVGEINGRASLTLAEREVVQITAAGIHGCEFCVSGHTALAVKKAGLAPAAAQALQQRGRTGDTRLDAVADFTRALIVARGNVGDGELEAFYGAGFDAQQALEVVLGVSLATLCNFANNLARNDINAELQPFRPGVFQP